MKTRIYFQPTSQILNAGDELINLATMNAIRRYGEIYVDDLKTPKWFVDSISTESDRLFSSLAPGRFYVSLGLILMKNLWAREKFRHVLVCSPGHSSRKGFREARKALNWYWKLWVLRKMGCTVIRAGFSIGPFDGVNGWIESFATRCFSFYGLRDREALLIAEKYRFSGARYFPDLAWSFVPPQRSAVFQESGPIIISFRSNAYGLIHSASYLAPIRQRLAALLKDRSFAGKRVIVSYQVQTDDEASREIFDYLNEVGIRAELIDHKLSIAEAAELYSTASCAISNRLHVLLLGAQSGTLPIPLANMKDNLKITSILSDNGLSDLIVDLEEGEEKNLRRVQKIMHDRVNLLRRLDEARQENTNLIHKEFASAFGVY